MNITNTQLMYLPENRDKPAQEVARHFGPLLPSCGEYAKLQSVFLGPFQVGQEQSGFNHKALWPRAREKRGKLRQ